MPLTPEQVEELKDQLREQVHQLPDDQKNDAFQQIDKMSSEAIEAMLENQKSQSSQEIFRLVLEGKIPSRKVAENDAAIAVLDIKPISKGHTIIIPKSQAKKSSQISSNAFELAKKVSEKIISGLKAEGTEIQTEFKFGEIIVNVVPIYDRSLNITSPRYEAQESELDEVQKMITIKEEKKIEVIKQPSKKDTEPEKLEKLDRKIP
jgi:diadenosine tetraphosphate (Ap4A) HIT family hydrolase